MKRALFACFLVFILLGKALALNPYELHQINKAHELGFSGKGVVVAIIDTGFNTEHMGLKDQNLSLITENPTLNYDFHGTYVAGVLLGKPIDPTLDYTCKHFSQACYYNKGIAYEAKYYGVELQKAFNNRNTTLDFYTPLKDKKEIKILNVSWGSKDYPIINKGLNNGRIIDIDYGDTQQVLSRLDTKRDTIKKFTKQTYELTKANKTLTTVAAGNDGILSPIYEAVLPYYDESLRGYIAVGALATHEQPTDNFYTINDEGKILITSPRAIADYTNNFKGAENFSLVAAGTQVTVPVNLDWTYYHRADGTSFAAPMAAGVGALVQEKFPFLTGYQIADVLLSTANKDYIPPKFTVKKIQGKSKTYYSIIYIDVPVPQTNQEIINDLRQYYNEKEIEKILTNLSPDQLVQSVKREVIFGQGILDAQKALNGLSILDANRLNLEDIQTHNNKKQAFYTLDVTASNSQSQFEFSNDISQKKVG